MKTDKHGQPITSKIREASTNTRKIDELIGICRGILFDNKVLNIEADNLLNWIESQPGISAIWPASELYNHLKNQTTRNLSAEIVNKDLSVLLQKIVGGELETTVDPTTGEISTLTPPSSLPLTNPDSIEFINKAFVLTGKFKHGTRAECENEITKRGGICLRSPTIRTDYIVIGTTGSRDWAHSSIGRKIQKAAMMVENGSTIEIISETQWLEALFSTTT